MTTDKGNPFILGGASHTDERGSLIAYNDFLMDPVRRMYLIEPASTKIVRAWQAHQHEKKWFFCINGSFDVKIMKLDDFKTPSFYLSPITFTLTASTPQVLYIPGGFANGFRSTVENSKLLVYSSYTFENSILDDFRYESNYWNVWEN